MTTRRVILLLDVMDTLVYDPFHSEVPAFFGTDLPSLLAHKDPDAWPRFETGEWDEERFAANYFRERAPLDARELAGFKATLSAAYRFLPGVEALLAELSAADVEMHALSNYPPWYRLIEERLRLSRFLRWSFVSCDTGVRKPDPEAYLGAARALSSEPQRCLFVDDRPRNVAAAQAVGMPAHRFRSAEALRAELVERGLLSGGAP